MGYIRALDLRLQEQAGSIFPTSGLSAGVIAVMLTALSAFSPKRPNFRTIALAAKPSDV
jgi:hypothetical protein